MVAQVKALTTGVMEMQMILNATIATHPVPKRLLEALDTDVAGYQVDRMIRNAGAHMPEPVRQASHRFREVIQTCKQ